MRTHSAIAALALLAAAARAQLVVGCDSAQPALWLIDAGGVQAPRELLAGSAAEANGIAADSVHSQLYWTNGLTLYRAAFATEGPLAPVLVGTITGAGTITGLAYDTAADALYGRAFAGIYRIDTATAAATLVYAITAQDFGAFDYNADDDCFYVANDSSLTTVVPGRGVYRVAKPWSSPTLTRLAGYPAGDTDIDGLAVGNGRVYLVNDVGAQGMYVLDIATGQYLAPAPLPYQGFATFAGGAWAPGLMSVPGADLGVTITDDPDPVVMPPGGNVTYTVTVHNNGPAAATAVLLSDTIPGGMTYVSSTPPGAPGNGVLTLALGDIALNASAAATIVLTPLTQGQYTNTVTVSASTPDGDLSDNSAAEVTTARPPHADLRAVLLDPADCTVGPGQVLRYTAHAENLGPQGAQGAALQFTLPTGAAFAGSQPPLTPSAGQLTWNIGALPSGQAAALTVDVVPGATGTYQASMQVSCTTTDPVPANNSASQSILIGGPAPTSASALGVVSTLADSPTSLAPGLGGARFTSLGRPFKSETGSRWVLVADTNAPDNSDGVLLAGGSSLSVVAREGMYPLLPTEPPGTYRPYLFDPVASINDAGEIAFSGIDTRTSTSADGFIVKSSGGWWVLVAQESFPVFAIGGDAAWGAGFGSVRLHPFGYVSFRAAITGVPATSDTAVFAYDGSSMIAREGESVPWGQANGATAAWAAFDTDGFHTGGDGYTHVVGGHLGATAQTRTLAVAGGVVVEAGTPIAGGPFSQPVTTIDTADMGSTYTWLATGSNADGADWVLLQGAVVAATGDPIAPGHAELWSQAADPRTFTLACGNNTGDWVIGGRTTDPDPLRNAVIVAGGRGVVLRTNDPVDLDADGQFNDDTYIRSFEAAAGFLSDDRWVYALVRVRSGAAARCGGPDIDLGQALVRAPLPAPPVACDPDFTCDGNTDQDDVGCIIDVVAGNPGCECADPDFNRDGNVDQDDVAALINVVAGGPCP